MFSGLRSLLVPLILAIGASGCGEPSNQDAPDAAPPGFCDATTPCKDDALPFCDEGGIYPDSNGKPNTCIAQPPDPECSDTVECTDEATPECTTIGECVECLNFSHCNATNPVCAFSTHTCGACRTGDDGNSVCSAIDPFQPYCSVNGSCVECLSNADCGIVSSPVCDATEFFCRGCQSTDECDAGVCNTDTGVCETAST